MTEYPPMREGIYFTGLVNFLTTECKEYGGYEFNGRFCEIGNSGYWIDNEIRFPKTDWDESEIEIDFRTHYGWNVAHNGVINSGSDNNMRLGVRRHFAKVVPDYKCTDRFRSDFDQYLRLQQRIWFTKNGKKMVSLYLTCFGKMNFEAEMREEARTLTLLPHPKRVLRLDTEREIRYNHQISKKVWAKSVWWKPKRKEMAKPSSEAKPKYVRLIVDLGVAASLQTVPFATQVKKNMDGKLFRYEGCECLFLNSPSPTTITQEMLNCWGSRIPVKMLVFSDDAIIVVLIDGVYRKFNADISSNDSTKTEYFFKNFMDCTECPDEVRVAIIKQILAPIRIISTNRKYCILIRAKEMYLQSGIGITTPVNTHAWMCMFVAIVDFWYQGRITCEMDLLKACEEVGHKITLEECYEVEDLQFLKMSLCLTSKGEYFAVLNLGVILRASGVCRDNLPGKGDMATRARNFQFSLMNGLLTGINFQPLRYLQPQGELVDVDFDSVSGALRYTMSGEVVWNSYDSATFYNRYRLTPTEIEELEYHLKHTGLGETCYSPAASKILKKDYGLTVPLE